MKTSFENKSIYVLAVSMALVMMFASVSFSADPAPKATAVVFAFAYVGMDSESAPGGNTNQDAVRQYAADLCTLINDGLAAHKRISVVKLEPRLSAVQRAVKEQKFTEKQVVEPIDTTPAGAAKAQKLASLVGAEIAIIGSVDKHTYNQQTREVELTCTIQMVDVSTGKVAEMFTATGRSAAAADGAQVDQLAMGIAATYDAAEKLLADMVRVDPTLRVSADGTVESTQPIVVEPARRKSQWPAILGAVLLGFVISGG